MVDALERPALYYPYIHIRSENWLKATLLCMPVVKRIVPESYTPEDDHKILKFTAISGPAGVLLQSVPSFSHAAYEAQERLLANLREHRDQIKRRFDRDHAPFRDKCWVHDAKFTYRLLEFLLRNKLAWPSEHSSAYGHRNWYALHPILGSAIMTTLGLSIAREEKYDIVTPSADVHDTLLATNEEGVFEALMSNNPPPSKRSLWQASRDLGQLVITLSGVNLRALRAEDIPELQASKHLRRFQRLIRTRTQNISEEEEPEAYREKLRLQAEEIIDSWADARSDLRGGFKELFLEPALVMSGEALKEIAQRSGVTELLIAGGVSVGLLLMKGLRFREVRKRGNALQYLTEIKRAENEVLRLTFPLGLESN